MIIHLSSFLLFPWEIKTLPGLVGPDFSPISNKIVGFAKCKIGPALMRGQSAGWLLISVIYYSHGERRSGGGAPITTQEHIAKQIASGQTELDVLLSVRDIRVQHKTAATNWLFI